MKIAEEITTIICDDVRQETSGKISLMGVFGSGIILNRIPAVISNLSFVVLFRRTKKVFHKVKMSLVFEDEEPIEISMDAPPMEKGSDHNFIFVLSPMKIEKPSKAKCSVFLDENEKPTIEHEFSFRMSKQL